MQEVRGILVREEKLTMAAGKRRNGCIKSTKGPWIVRRRGKDGVPKMSLRVPSERERENNRLREQKRRRVAANIYAGLKEHGNYNLPKHADQNDVLIALCKEAGWQVEEDGTIHRIDSTKGSNDKPVSMKEEEQLSLNLTLAYRYM